VEEFGNDQLSEAGSQPSSLWVLLGTGGSCKGTAESWRRRERESSGRSKRLVEVCDWLRGPARRLEDARGRDPTDGRGSRQVRTGVRVSPTFMAVSGWLWPTAPESLAAGEAFRFVS
jgi:hypothetical protein